MKRIQKLMNYFLYLMYENEFVDYESQLMSECADAK